MTVRTVAAMVEAAPWRGLALALALACAACGRARETGLGSGSPARATACNYVSWFADGGLVSRMVQQQSQSEMPFNATQVCLHIALLLTAWRRCARALTTAWWQDDCLSSCAVQLAATRGNSSAQREDFMACCVWFR
jgi:hypothetical protein